MMVIQVNMIYTSSAILTCAQGPENIFSFLKKKIQLKAEKVSKIRPKDHKMGKEEPSLTYGKPSLTATTSQLTTYQF